MVAGQPSSQPRAGDDTGTRADTGTPPHHHPPTLPGPAVKHHRIGFRAQWGGKHCIYADISPSVFATEQKF